MTTSKVANIKQSVVLIEETLTRPLTPAQRKFNAALAKIDKQRAELANWQQTDQDCQQYIMGKMAPLNEELIQERIKALLFFDHAILSYKLTKTQKRKLSHLIADLSDQLLFETEDEQLVELCYRYPYDNRMSDDDYEEAMLAIDAFEKEYLKSVEAEKEARQAIPPEKPRKKTAKQLEKEAKEKQDAELAQQSIQNIYRHLVKTLHPDREPNHDERDRKTQLMQEITVAYEEKNLVRLLELQREETQRDLPHQLADEQLQRLILLLEQQWQQLKMQTQQIEDRYQAMLNTPSFGKLTPKKLHSYFKQEIRSQGQRIRQIRMERMTLEQDPNMLKELIKTITLPY